MFRFKIINKTISCVKPQKNHTLLILQFYLVFIQKQDLMDQQEDDYLFTILHFNDVYDIQPNKKGKNGIVSFQSYVSRMKKKYPKNLLLFSGDCFSPSILTHIYQGRHMVKALNTLGIDVACYGNHQFDLQQNLTVELAESCNFPWLLGNIRYKNSQFLMGNGKPYIIKQVFNMRIGIFGVAGQDWLGILKQYLEKVDYEDVGQFSKKITKYLKQQQKCDMIIALTHMRTYQDQKLPHQAPLIDISLGGHDHIIMNQFINQIPVIKSGDNFKTLGIIHVSKKSKNYTNYQYKGRNFNFSVSIKQIPNPSPKQINQQLKNHVDKCMAKYLKSDHLIGYTDVPLQIRFAQVRTKETNYGNFLTDLVRLYYDVDCCIMNAGCIRIDGIIPAGQLRYSVISNIINNPMIVKQISGETLLRTLQFAVSGLPGFPGNFLCVSGIRYTFDINKTPRVQQVFINNQPLIEDRKYMMSVNMYIGKGGDGFSMLKQCKTIIDQIAAIDLLRLILKFFKGKNKQKGYKTIKDVVKQKREHKPKNQDESQSQQQTLSPYQLKLYRRVSTKTSRMQTFKKKYIIPHGHSDLKYICITPKIDGRIRSL